MRHKTFSFVFVMLFLIGFMAIVGSATYLVSLYTSSVIDSNTITEPNNATHLIVDNSNVFKCYNLYDN